jgi:hypothetical protein
MAVRLASIFSPSGSRAKAEAPPVSERDSTIRRLLSGGRLPESFAYFDPSCSSSRTWRTFSLSLLTNQDGHGARFLGTWPRSAMSLRGTVYPLPPLVPRTSATGCSPLLPTPRAAEREARQGKRTPSQEAGTHGKSLYAEVQTLALLPGALRTRSTPPTPKAADGEHSPNLAKALTLLPTPCARDWKGEGYEGQLPTEIPKLLPTPRAAVDKEHGPNGQHWAELRPIVESLSGGASTSPPSEDGSKPSGLRLSPWFVEWMMGAPHGWSDPDCPLSATEFRSKLGISSESDS